MNPNRHAPRSPAKAWNPPPIPPEADMPLQPPQPVVSSARHTSSASNAEIRFILIFLSHRSMLSRRDMPRIMMEVGRMLMTNTSSRMAHSMG